MCPLTLSMVLCVFPSVMQTMCFLHPFVLSRAIISFDLPLDLAINSFNEASEVTDQIHVKFPSSSHSFTHSFLPSYVPSFNHSFLPSFLQSAIHSFIPSFIRSKNHFMSKRPQLTTIPLAICFLSQFHSLQRNFRPGAA
jgi:hypothetical protein